MSRLLLLGAGALLLIVAAAWRDPPARAGRTTLTAVGQSMGGMRVVVIDALYFRAEALRKRGRVEDAAALYRAILELDPANEAATIFLANLFVGPMLALAVDEQDRYLWWREGHRVLVDALARRPRSATLHNRAADLILGLPLSQPDLEPLLAKELGNWRLAALRHLRYAFEETGVLRRLGRNHVLRAALLSSDVAARALRAGAFETFEEAMAISEALAARRPGELEALLVRPDHPETLWDVVRADREALEQVRSAQVEGVGHAEAEDAIARADAAWPDRALPVLLREVLDAPR